MTLVRLASTNIVQQHNVLGTDSFDSLKDITLKDSQFSLDSSELLSDVPTDFVSKVAEPTLKSLGFCNETPSGLIQYGLEYLHVDYGVPWWGTVVAGISIILSFKYFFNRSDPI